MIIFHGTNANFEQFKNINFEDCTHEYYGNSIYFSDNYDVASFYGSRIFSVNIPDSEITNTFNAGGLGVKQNADVISKLILEGGIIKVVNTYDSTQEGAQCIHVNFDEPNIGKFKYIQKYFLKMPVLKTKAKSLMNRYYKITGIECSVLYNNIFCRYDLYSENITEDFVSKYGHTLKQCGIIITKELSRTPKNQTTIIFAGSESIEKLNHYIKSSGTNV